MAAIFTVIYGVIAGCFLADQDDLWLLSSLAFHNRRLNQIRGDEKLREAIHSVIRR
jgi:hypothetical protein